MEHLTTEQNHPDSCRLDQMTAREIVDLMNRQDRLVVVAVEGQGERVAAAIDLVAERLRKSGRLFYIGAGTSGRLGVLDASECPPTFNTPPEMVQGIIAGGNAALTRAIEGAEDNPELARDDLQSSNLNANDVVVGIATSGRTPYVIGGLQFARQTGAATIALTCNQKSELHQQADIVIAPITGPEIISGSTRMKAGTATKMVLNMISTGAMVRLGKTWANLMVDLRASNSKLLDRSIRIVRRIADVDSTDASFALQQCNGEVKTAIVSIICKLSAIESRQLLKESNGHLRSALITGSQFNDESHVARTIHSERNLLLGVDAGGSKTVAWLAAFPADRSEPVVRVAEGTAGPGNPVAAGLEAATQNIQAAIDQALVQGNISISQIQSTCIAIAGGGRQEMRDQITAWARRQGLAGNLQVVDDAQPVLAAGIEAVAKNLAVGPAVQIALIAGTGSIAVGRIVNHAGQTTKQVRCGGWGYILGDEGSGYAIALAALQAACRSADGRAPMTELLPRLLDRLQLSSTSQIAGWIHHAETCRDQIARLAPLVFDLAGTDELANRIVETAGNQLAEMVLSVYRQLGDSQQTWLLALSGSVLVHQPNLQILRRLNEAGLPVPFTLLVESPVSGCLSIANSGLSTTS